MVSARNNLDDLSRNAIDQSVRCVNSPTPKTAQISPKLLRLPDPIIAIPQNVLQKLIDLFQRLFILRLPKEVVFPAIFGKLILPIGHLLQLIHGLGDYLPLIKLANALPQVLHVAL